MPSLPTLLTPWTAALAAALAAGLLLLLYFLKLRRRRARMASTLLWTRSFDDLQVNVPFQRLRLSALFLLQLILLLLLAVALGDPVVSAEGPLPARVILLIDRSASMNARDEGEAPGATRLDAARRAAREIVDRFTAGRVARPVMVIAFGARAEVISGFETRRPLLHEALDGIEPTDEEADLAAALALAGSFAQRGEEAEDDAAEVVLISDGGVAPPEDPAGFALRAGGFRYVRVPAGAVSPPVGNVGVIALSARRDYEEATRVLVFCRLLNSGPAPADTLLTLYVDDEPGPMKRVEIGAAPEVAGAGGTGPGPSGETSVSFAIDLAGGAIISVRHGERDPLPADDTAAVVLPPPARPRIVLVHAGAAPDPFLHELLVRFEPEVLRVMTAPAFEALDPLEADLGRRFDVLVLDRVRLEQRAGLPTLSFGAGAGPGEQGDGSEASSEGRRILSWQRRHPLLRHVSLDTVVYAAARGLEVPPGGVALATGPEGPVIVLDGRESEPRVDVSFALARSNWPRHVSVAVFVQNVLDAFTRARSGRSSRAIRPGEAISRVWRGEPGEIIVRGPADREIGGVRAVPGNVVTLPMLRQVGLYTIDGLDPPDDLVAVSMLSAVESDIRPRETILVNARDVAAASASAGSPRPVWRWVVAAAFALLAVEWLVYCRRMRV